MDSSEEESPSEMEGASAKANWPEPGLLTFKKLAINKGQITRAEEKMMESNIQNQENIIRDDHIYSVQLRNAAKNVKGLMLYHSNKKTEAIQMWKETLKSDSTNLNALKDIAAAYHKLRFSKKADKYAEEYETTLKKVTSEKKIMMFARCQFEQGYALSQDLYTRSWRGEKLVREQVRCYEEALKMGKDLVDKDEKRDWLLYTGKAYDKLCGTNFRNENKEQYRDNIGKAIENLHKALQIPLENQYYHAEIWLTIGITFDRCKNERPSSLPTIVEKHYKEYWENPLGCFKEALKLNPKNVWLLGRVGVQHFNQNDYVKAMKVLTEAIDMAEKLPDEDRMKKASWNALCHRAKINIKKATILGSSPQHEDTRFSLLLLAQKDANKALEFKYAPIPLITAGEVHRLLANQAKMISKDQVDALRNIALDRFYETSILQDGSTIADLHLKWAMCLQDAKDLSSAIHSFKIAIEKTKNLPSQCKFRSFLGYKLISAMLKHYKDLKKPKKQLLLPEISFWFLYIQVPSHAVIIDLEKPAKENAPEIIDMLEYIVEHIGGLFSNAQDLSKRVIKKTIDEISHNGIKAHLRQRLESVRRKNTENTETAPDASQESSAESSLSDTYNPGPQTALTEGVAYDFHIIHDETNHDIDRWVRYSLLSGLECSFYGLKGYYRPRDATLGALRNAERARIMEKSAKILIILSHDFHESDSLTTEMAQCKHQKNTENIIVLQRENAPVPLNLRCYKKFDFTVQVDLPELARYLLPVHSMWDI